MNSFLQQYAFFILLIVIWELFWKAWAMWIAARQGDKAWYILLLIINSGGFLAIAYIFFFAKATRTKAQTTPQELNS
jgi:hypothetical protein